MFCRSTARRGAVAGAACALVLVHGAGEASAGEFQMANCQSDSLNFSTRAFGDFATRGMQIKRACNPEGPGLRGLITSNVVRAGTGAARLTVTGHDQRAPGHAFHVVSVGGHGAPARLPLRAAALRRRAAARRPARTGDFDQERARQRGLPAPGARQGRRLQVAHLQRVGRDPDRAARGVRRRRRPAIVLGARRQLHPHLQGHRRCRRRRATRGLDPARHAAGARRMGERQPAAEL